MNRSIIREMGNYAAEPNELVFRLGSGMPARVIAEAAGMVRIEYVDGPFRGRRSAYRVEEMGRFFTRASYPPARAA